MVGVSEPLTENSQHYGSAHTSNHRASATTDQPPNQQQHGSAIGYEPPTGVDGAAAVEVQEEIALSDPTLPKSRAKRELTWWRLAMIAFVFTCSGPGGLEQVVIAGGPLLAVIGIFAVPVLYVMPQIFVVAEMGSMMPTSAGNVVWVHRAFGRFAGFYNAWVFALTNMVDMAGYPVLFGDYIVDTYHSEATYWEKMAYRIGGLIIGVLVSLLSAKDVSNVATVCSTIVIAFCVICFFGATPNIRPRQWSVVADEIDYSLLGSSLLWLYTGWTSLGSLAGETKHCRVLIQGMSAALSVDVVVYLMALFAALTVALPDEWDDGFFVTAFNRVIHGVGPYFGGAIILTALSMSISAMICYSRSVWGIAEMGWAPHQVTRQLSTGAPHISVFMHALVAFGLVWFDFGFIVKVEYTVAATSYLLTYGAFLRLRYTEPDAPRPYKVPGGMPFAWLLTLTKVLVMGATCVAGLASDWRIGVAFGITNVVVIGAFLIYRRFAPVQPALPVDDNDIRRHTMEPSEDALEEAGATKWASVDKPHQQNTRGVADIEVA